MQITSSIIMSIFFFIRLTSIAYAFDTNVDLTGNKKID